MNIRDRLILLVLAGGFVTLGIEVRYMHREVLNDEWQTWIPLIYSVVAVLAALIAIFGSYALRQVVAALFGFGVFAGLYGGFLHTEGKAERLMVLFSSASSEHDSKRRRIDTAPPALAPLGFSGLSAIGFIMLFRRREQDAEVVEQGLDVV